MLLRGKPGSAATAIAVLVLVLAAGASARSPLGYWPFAKLMARLDSVKVVVGERPVRIEPELTLCSGRGKPIRIRSARRWSSFDCIQTTVDAHGRDLEFRIRVLGPTRLAVSDARYAGR